MNENGRKKVVEEEDWNLCAFSFGGSGEKPKARINKAGADSWESRENNNNNNKERMMRKPSKASVSFRYWFCGLQELKIFG